MNSSTLSPVVCATWCEAGDGHADATHTEDQVCFGESWELKLTADAVAGAPNTLAVYREQAAGGPVEVRLSHNEGSGPLLELADVERLRNELTSILESHAPALLTVPVP